MEKRNNGVRDEKANVYEGKMKKKDNIKREVREKGSMLEGKKGEKGKM